MTIAEASYKWGISENTIKGRLKESRRTKQIEDMENQGIIKSFCKPQGKRKEWIISEEAMEIWFRGK